ncbi:MAG: hypothetical protein QM570_14675 [Planctomycetota bacterium]|nr:hypothetical protein [Planctomycetota bacterium]
MKELDVLSAKARTFLRTAEQTLSTGDYDSCASRYYDAKLFMLRQWADREAGK